MRKRLLLSAMVCTLSATVLTGCFNTQVTGKGTLIARTTQIGDVLIDGIKSGRSNEAIPDIESGAHKVLIVDEAGTVLYEGQVMVEQGKTVTIDTDAVLVDGTGETQSLVDGEQNGLIDEVAIDPALDGTDGTDIVSDDAYDLNPKALNSQVTADFYDRDKLPQTHVPRSQWRSYGSWGPPSADYPAPRMAGADTASWKRDRIVAVARKYLGVRYKHVHIPAMGGLDCSNYTSWVYNYGLGIKFTSAVADQGRTVGRTVSRKQLLPGDLIFFRSSGTIVHTGIYLGNGVMVDESTMNGGGGKVAMKKLNSGWVNSHYAYAKRVIW